MSANSEAPPRSGPLPPDPGFLEQRLLPQEQTALQTSLAALGLTLDELPEADLVYRFWQTLAGVRLMDDLRERHPCWSETRVRTQAAHMLGLKETTLRARLNRLPGR